MLQFHLKNYVEMHFSIDLILQVILFNAFWYIHRVYSYISVRCQWLMMRNRRPWFYHLGSHHQSPFSRFLVNQRLHQLHLQTVLSSPHRKAVLPPQKQKLQTDPSQKGRFSSAVTRCWLREVTNETNVWKIEFGLSFFLYRILFQSTEITFHTLSDKTASLTFKFHFMLMDLFDRHPCSFSRREMNLLNNKKKTQNLLFSHKINLENNLDCLAWVQRGTEFLLKAKRKSDFLEVGYLFYTAHPGVRISQFTEAVLQLLKNVTFAFV